MKKRLLSLALSLALCLGSALPALAYGDMGKAGGCRQTISMNSNDSWVVKEDNSLWGWGKNETDTWRNDGEGLLGNGGGGNAEHNYSVCQTVPVKIMDDVASVCAGGVLFTYVLVIKTDGTLWSWGFNRYGNLGDGTMEDRFTPKKIMDDVAAVSAGFSHAFAIKTDGSLWGWGYNGEGLLGNGGGGNETIKGDLVITDDGPVIPDVPVQTVPVKIMDGVAAVSAGSSHSFVIKTDGTLWAWGDNLYGQLGNGGTGNEKKQYLDRSDGQYKDRWFQTVPVKIMDDVAAASAGDDHSLAVKTDGTLWVWGCNIEDQLGYGSGGNAQVIAHAVRMSGGPAYFKMWIQTVPVKIMDSVAAASTGDHRCFAVKTDGTLWAWGENGILHELGDGTEEYQLTPVKTMDDVVAVSVGFDNGIALKTDGTLWGWGENAWGILGQINLNAEFATPIRITDKVKLPTASAPAPSAPATPSEPSTPTTNAVLSPQKLAIDGENIDCEKYNIGGSNYFKLRDLAQLLDGTGSQFGVGFDAATSTVTITTGAAYTPAGGELAAGVDNSSTAQPSSQAILIDGVKHDELTVYNIGGSNFFQLRELGNILGFEVGYDQDTNTAIVRSTQK